MLTKCPTIKFILIISVNGIVKLENNKTLAYLRALNDKFYSQLFSFHKNAENRYINKKDRYETYNKRSY